MIEILIDTNIYRKDPGQDGLAFKALERLSKAGAVRLHIPYIVLREFQTQQLDQYRKEMQAALKGISSIYERRLTEEIKFRVGELKSAIENIIPLVENDAQVGLVTWANNIGGVLYPLDIVDAQRAMEAYFTGQPPFKEPKARKDIPDAFLFQAAQTIGRTVDKLYVISEDGAFGEAMATLENVILLKSLNVFVELPEVQAMLAQQEELEKISLVVEELKVIPSELISCFAQDIGERILWKKIYSRSIHDDNHEASISSYGEPEDIQIDFEQAAYYGDGQLGLPFTCKMTVSAFYYIFKSDFYSMNLEDQPSVSDHNDHYFEAEGEFEIEVNGSISVNVLLDEVGQDKEIDEYVNFDTVEIDEVDEIILMED